MDGLETGFRGSVLQTAGLCPSYARTHFGEAVPDAYDGLAMSGDGSVTNAGAIVGDGTHGYGIALNGASLTNLSGG
jgi:hypothetical protein